MLKITQAIFVLYVSSFSLLLGSSNTALADTDQRAYMLTSSCAACHGPDGKSPDAIPSLHGKNAAFIVKSLMAFKHGTRSATVMNRLAKGYTDAEIIIIANWFATRP